MNANSIDYSIYIAKKRNIKYHPNPSKEDGINNIDINSLFLLSISNNNDFLSNKLKIFVENFHHEQTEVIFIGKEKLLNINHKTVLVEIKGGDIKRIIKKELKIKDLFKK